MWVAVALAAALAAAPSPRTFGPERLPEVRDEEDPLVDAGQMVPGLLVRLAYARPDNVAGRALYPPDARCLLRRSVAERLARAARALAARKLRLVAWDCTRPAGAQLELFRVHPHPGNVADPVRGSLHARGVAVDLGLADRTGAEVPLPTAFDAFGPAAAVDAPLPPGPPRQNRDALVAALREAGFRPNPKEWWHFSRLWGWRWPLARVDAALRPLPERVAPGRGR